MNKLLLFSSIWCICFVSCSDAPPKPVPPKPLVNTIQATLRDIESSDAFPANITGKNNNDVRPKTSGYIKEMLVDEGQRVKKGQLLFRLETNIQNQNQNAAKAQVETATANVESAQAQVKLAQVEVGRLVPLVEKGIISSVQLETAKANLQRAQSQVNQAQASVSVTQSNLMGISEDIKFSNVVSPIDGVVGKLNFREGALVSPQTALPITTISDISEIFAYFTLNEKQFIHFFQNSPGADLDAKIKKIDSVQLKLSDGSIYPFKGKITTSTGQIDPSTGTIKFRVSIRNNGLLSNGSTGEILIPRNLKNVLVIPESAIFEQQGFAYVYKVQGDSILSAVVGVKDRINNLAIIDKGIKPDEELVANGVDKLRNGIKVNPLRTSIDSVANIPRVK